MADTNQSYAEYILGLKQASDEIAAYQGELEQNQALAVGAGNVRRDAQERSNVAVQQVTQLRGQQTLETENRLAQLQQTEMPDTVRFKTAAAVSEAHNQLADALAQTQQLQSVSFFDNPMQYLVNSVQLPTAQTKLAQAQQTVDILTEANRKVAQDVTATAQAIRATARTTNEAIEKSLLLQQQAEGQARIADIDRQAAMDGTQFLTQRMQLDRQVREPLERAQLARIEQGKWNEQAELRRLQLENARQSAEDRKADDTAVMRMAGIAYRQAQANGDVATAQVLAAITKPSQLRALIGTDKAFADKYSYLVSTGALSEQSGKRVFGSNPLESALSVRAYNLPVSPEQNRSVTAIERAVTAIRQDPRWAAGDKNEKIQLEKQAADMAMANLPPMSPAALINFDGGLEAATTEIPVLAAINATAQPDSLETWDKLYGQVKEAVKSGAIKPQDAANQISYLALKGRNATNETAGYDAMGMKPPTTLRTAPVGTKQGVNLVDEVEVLKDLIATQQRGTWYQQAVGNVLKATPLGGVAAEALTRTRTAEDGETLQRLQELRRNSGATK